LDDIHRVDADGWQMSRRALDQRVREYRGRIGRRSGRRIVPERHANGVAEAARPAEDNDPRSFDLLDREIKSVHGETLLEERGTDERGHRGQDPNPYFLRR
jgi:hypothetical protein